MNDLYFKGCYVVFWPSIEAEGWPPLGVYTTEERAKEAIERIEWKPRTKMEIKHFPFDAELLP